MRKFSIILPTLNRPHLINRAISAIFKQNYKEWELIIVNGGNKLNIPFKDDRIILIEEPDKGITDAMNKGMRKATGDIFCWANDDDELKPDVFSWVNENLHLEWGYGLITMTDGTKSYLWGRVDDEATLAELLQGNFVPQPAVFWTRKAYETVGPMDEEHDLTSDYEYWIRLWKAFPPQKFQKIMATYHLHPEQITQRKMKEQLAQAAKTSQKHAH